MAGQKKGLVTLCVPEMSHGCPHSDKDYHAQGIEHSKLVVKKKKKKKKMLAYALLFLDNSKLQHQKFCPFVGFAGFKHEH